MVEGSMSLEDRYDLEFLVNEAERMVLEELEEQLSKDTEGTICKCEECVLDMAAYALNNVPPAYRASLLGSLYAKAMDQTEYAEKVKKAVQEAIEVVSKNPNHA
jgi:competence protein ComFB